MEYFRVGRGEILEGFGKRGRGKVGEVGGG